MATPGGILIVSASTGTGHRSAGDALHQALRERTPAASVEHVDLLELAPRWVRAAYGGGYELVATRAPRLWRELYRRTDSPEGDRARWGPVAQRLLFREFRRLLLSGRWRACLCTHFLPGQLAAGHPHLPPFAMVITDLTLHRFWAQPRVRRYFTATRPLAEEVRRRLPGARVDATGIPVAPRFASAPGRAEARAMLGLDPCRPAVLVIGGGLGIGVAESARAAVSASVEGLQVVAVCGRNEAAYRELHEMRLPPDRLRVYGYTGEMERLVAAADLVVTKPGGLTCSEALAAGRPLLLTRPIPGQEEGNVRALTEAGAALATPDRETLRLTLERVLADAAALPRLAASAWALGRPHAAHEIADAMQSEYLAEAAA